MLFINFNTGMDFPWFIFPCYAILWWPILSIFIGKYSLKILSLIGSALTIGMLFALNYFTSWGFPWFVYPSLAILWWPIVMFFGARAHRKTLSIVGSTVLIATVVTTNLIVPEQDIWFYYAVFAIVWWPLSEFYANKRTIRAFSIIGAVVIIALLTLANDLESPAYLWAPLAYYPAIMWPMLVLLGRRMGKLNVALCGCLGGILYYMAMNIWLFPGFPWVIFPAYALLWWPLAIAFAKKGKLLKLSIVGSLFSTAFFIAVNLLTSPQSIWFVYPTFALCWWPLASYYAHRLSRSSSVPS
jgi:hypothetical protein